MRAVFSFGSRSALAAIVGPHALDPGALRAAVTVV